MKNKLLVAGLMLTVAITGFITGRLATRPAATTAATPTTAAAQCQPAIETRSGGYQFINPLLECDNYRPSTIKTTENLEVAIRSYVAESIARNKCRFAAVYLRDLNNGPWIGINEEEIFTPASLLKVPIMMAVFKKAETEPAFLNKKINYTGRVDIGMAPNIVDQNILNIGHTYTIQELTERMIKYSDNEAKELLVNQLGFDHVLAVMRDIGINTNADLSGDFVTVKVYAGFFKLLYNATYLNREYSEKALRILAECDYKQGLVAGLPEGTVVAHKFGERVYPETGVKQLHECGIVYLQSKPYLLCVMTRGEDFTSLASVISGLSSLVYNQISSV